MTYTPTPAPKPTYSTEIRREVREEIAARLEATRADIDIDPSWVASRVCTRGGLERGLEYRLDSADLDGVAREMVRQVVISVESRHTSGRDNDKKVDRRHANAE